MRLCRGAAGYEMLANPVEIADCRDFDGENLDFGEISSLPAPR